MWLIVLGLFLFVLLIVLHEYGHFLVAKRNGVDVEEFGIGFPPKLFGKKLGKGIFEGYYTINLLPLGGFVRLKGEEDAATEKGSFGSVGLSAKLRIMLAGVAVNLLAALVFFTIVAWVGMPQVIPNQFSVPSDSTVLRNDIFAGYVDADSPAAQAGLQVGDTIVSLNNQPITNEASVREVASANAGNTVPIVYERDGQTTMATTTLLSEQQVADSKNTDTPKGYLGVVPRKYTLIQSTWSAPIVAVGVSAQLTHLTLKALGEALYNLVSAFFSAITGNTKEARQEASKAGENVSGPVGIFAILQQGTDLGYQFILFVVAVISLTLAIMNFLPIPALDGGRAFVMLLFKAMKKPLTPDLEARIHGTGFAALMILFVVITVVDIRRFY
ncbi:site-2 protease family protein [Candidatus Nomurabacteria bacterium]|nr:site-2 protease family protein [Candidatus Nomurabacteria bacterium]